MQNRLKDTITLFRNKFLKTLKEKCFFAVDKGMLSSVNIDIRQSTTTVAQLIHKLENGFLDGIHNSVSDESSINIEMQLMRLPPLTIWAHSDGDLWTIRSYTDFVSDLILFVGGEFALEGLGFTPELNGCAFTNLAEHWQTRLLDSVLLINLIPQTINLETREHILNTVLRRIRP